MEKYRVYKKAELRFTIDAIESCGGKILNDPDPRTAPFDLQVSTPAGDVVQLICYIFRANKYRQKGRPADEHRIQIKYGSDFHRYHEIYIDATRSSITLMFGVHLEEKLFVAVDPAMHNPTWFSKSVELKDHHIESIQREGWSGWERERAMGRRKRSFPLENCQTEVLLGFLPDRFIQYIDFETLATGLDSGSRLLFADQLAHRGTLLPLEKEFGLPAFKLLELINETSRLKVAVRGSVAEERLHQHLARAPGITRVRRLDKDGKPDFEIDYRGRTALVECKNVLRRKYGDRIKVDFQKTRPSKSDPCTRYYSKDEFEILAACLFPVTEAWSFRFCRTDGLSPHPTCRGKLSQHVYVDDDGWRDSILQVL